MATEFSAEAWQKIGPINLNAIKGTLSISDNGLTMKTDEDRAILHLHLSEIIKAKTGGGDWVILKTKNKKYTFMFVDPANSINMALLLPMFVPWKKSWQVKWRAGESSAKALLELLQQKGVDTRLKAPFESDFIDRRIGWVSSYFRIVLVVGVVIVLLLTVLFFFIS